MGDIEGWTAKVEGVSKDWMSKEELILSTYCQSVQKVAQSEPRTGPIVIKVAQFLIFR